MLAVEAPVPAGPRIRHHPAEAVLVAAGRELAQPAPGHHLGRQGEIQIEAPEPIDGRDPEPRLRLASPPASHPARAGSSGESIARDFRRLRSSLSGTVTKVARAQEIAHPLERLPSRGDRLVLPRGGGGQRVEQCARAEPEACARERIQLGAPRLTSRVAWSSNESTGGTSLMSVADNSCRHASPPIASSPCEAGSRSRSR